MKFCQIVRHFALVLIATERAALVRSINDISLRIRRRMSQWRIERSPLAGALEADEFYFGPRRVRGKRGRGTSGKALVFGLLDCGDCIYTEITSASQATLKAIIRGKADIESVIYTVGWCGYDRLGGIGFDKNLRGNHGNNSSSGESITSTELNPSGALPNAGSSLPNIPSACI